MDNKSEMYIWGLINIVIGVVFSLLVHFIGVIGILIGILYFLQASWARVTAITLYWLAIVAGLVKVSMVLYATGFNSELWMALGVYAVIAIFYFFMLSRLSTKSSKAFFYGVSDLRMDLDADSRDEGWVCSKCKNINKYSVNCWNCDAPKPITESKQLEISQRAQAEAPKNKLDEYLEKKQKEIGSSQSDDESSSNSGSQSTGV